MIYIQSMYVIFAILKHSNQYLNHKLYPSVKYLDGMF